MAYILLRALIGAALLTQGPAALGSDSHTKPLQVVNGLADRMYAIAETTGKREDWQAAIERSRQAIHDYVSEGGDPADLTEKDSRGVTPLIAAAYMGYPDIVEELLTHEAVVAGIDDADTRGVSAWSYANFAYRQSAWLCNPTITQSLFALVPLLVTQPYYMAGNEPPYRKTRRLLEAAGAKADMAVAKQRWLAVCKSADVETRRKVAESSDLLDTVVGEGLSKMPLFSGKPPDQK